MTVSELIRTKRAVRQFTNEPLSQEAIRTILNAGRGAQSSKNTQPWHFIAIRDRATLQQLAQCGAYAGHLAGAPFAIALISSVADGFDLGQAAANMQLAAWELGIGHACSPGKGQHNGIKNDSVEEANGPGMLPILDPEHTQDPRKTHSARQPGNPAFQAFCSHLSPRCV